MYLEIPECRRCCCLPLRHGIIIFGYINLLLSILILVLETMIEYMYHSSGHTVAFYKGSIFFIQGWLAMLLYVLEVAFNIMLVIGAHKKNARLLHIYYYYGITTTLATILSFLVVRKGFRDWIYTIIEVSFVICGLGVQVYLLFLVRSELIKLRKNSGLRFVNHVSEVLVEPTVTEGRNPF